MNQQTTYTRPTSDHSHAETTERNYSSRNKNVGEPRFHNIWKFQTNSVKLMSPTLDTRIPPLRQDIPLNPRRLETQGERIGALASRQRSSETQQEDEKRIMLRYP